MARKHTNTFEDLIAVAALLPWWAGILGAAVSYAILHHFAIPTPKPPAQTLNDLSASIAPMLVATICQFLQYLVPLACLIGAGISAWQAVRARSLLAAAQTSPEDERLASFSWREFETLVAQAFRERGYTVRERGGNGPDGGVDIELRMGADKYLVQCKHWKAQSVGVVVVRELFGVMTAERAVGGFVVASGGFTKEATQFADGRSIELVDANRLIAGVNMTSNEIEVAAPTCPRCGTTMVLRTARQGANARSAFWGCTGYPRCRGTRPATGRA